MVIEELKTQRDGDGDVGGCSGLCQYLDYGPWPGKMSEKGWLEPEYIITPDKLSAWILRSSFMRLGWQQRTETLIWLLTSSKTDLLGVPGQRCRD